MSMVIRIKKRHALAGLVAVCSAAGFLFGFTAHAKTRPVETDYQPGERIQVETGLEDGYSNMNFTCLESAREKSGLREIPRNERFTGNPIPSAALTPIIVTQEETVPGHCFCAILLSEEMSALLMIPITTGGF